MTEHLLFKKNRLFILLSLCIFMTACATIPSRPILQPITATSNAWLSQQQQINLISDWTVRGRIAVQMTQQGGSASIFWKQQDQDYAIELFGPLGVGAVYLNGMPGQIVLTSSKGEHLQAATPEILIQRALGWNLPVTNLKYWIRGIPVQGQTKTTQFNNLGQLSQLQQDGWTINYLSYFTVKNVFLPQQILLQGQGLVVKIFIDNWQV